MGEGSPQKQTPCFYDLHGVCCHSGSPYQNRECGEGCEQFKKMDGGACSKVAMDPCKVREVGSIPIASTSDDEDEGL
jgi:hypothetical protein